MSEDFKKSYAVGQLLEVVKIINKKGLECQSEEAKTAYYEAGEIIMKHIQKINTKQKNPN